MKRKSGWMIMIMAGLILCSSGCGRQPIEDTTENSSISEEEAELVDEQYLLEHCGVTKEELEGIDVEDFIKRYELTEQSIADENVQGLIALYRRYLEREEHKKTYGIYADIFNGGATGGYQDEYENQITILALVEDGGGQTTMVFDFGRTVYYCATPTEGDVIDDYSTASKTGELREEDMQEIRSIIREAGVSSWQARTGERNPDHTDFGSWSLAIECSDGKRYVYSGYEYPEGFYDNVYVKLLELIDVEVPMY